MEEIVRAHQQVVASKAALQEAVTAARRQGHTWQEIGDALHMSRQAAFKRFGKPTQPKEPKPVEAQSVAPVLDITERAFDLVATADYDQLHRLMTPATSEALTADLIAATWSGVLAEVGQLESCDNTHVELPDGTPLDPDEEVLGSVVAATTLRCEAGELLGRIAFDADRKIIGVLIVPEDHGELPF
ncbi:MAG: hypothetical protein AAF962_24065 [Actinomycetota bacterium]